MSDNQRSAPYPLLLQNAQSKVNSNFFDTDLQPNPVFDANDEWVYVYRTTGNPGVGLAIVDQYNQVINCDEPFFVSGKGQYQISSVSGFVTVSKAKRRELLSWNQPRLGGASNDPVQSILLNRTDAIGALASAANWFYLDGNLAWQQSAVGDIGAGPDPFGAASPVATSRRGRYYDVMYQFETTVGTLSAYIVHRVGTARPAFLISTGPTGLTGQSGLVHIGDETPIAPLGGLTAGGYAQSTMLGSQSWTIAVTNNVAATLSGTLRISRRGF